MDFTEAWDDYMERYEAYAMESIERLKRDQKMEMYRLKQNHEITPKKFNQSKKLAQYRALEKNNKATRAYDEAIFFKAVADQLEDYEQFTSYAKDEIKLERMEMQLNKKHTAFMSNFLKRI